MGQRMELHNRITNPAFREGILEAMGYKMKEVPLEEREAMIKDIEENWWFAGGRDTKPDSGTACPYDVNAWKKLWEHYFGQKPMPDTCEFCVCRQDGLRYNLYVTNGERVIIIGSVCMYQFLPRIARQVKEKRCDRCMKPHKNRSNNYCKPCRVVVKEEEKRRVQEEYERRLLISQEREAERKRQEEARRARICQCGCGKLPQYPVCYVCSKRKKSEEMNRLTPQQKKAMFCSCGAKKKPQFVTCWGCSQ